MTDNTNRIIQELEEVVDQLPSPIILTLLNIWEDRIEELQSKIETQKNTVLFPILLSEMETVAKCSKELRAALVIERGRIIEGFEYLLK